ncbi:MAG: TetR/AcrR family transcriptional regulator [Bulleidia sp.]
MNTKEKIMTEALHLFSCQGYHAVSVEQIAEAVGIRAPSLYKHFKGKQDIFDAIVKETERRYREFTDSVIYHEPDVNEIAQINADDIAEKLMSFVSYSLHDPYVRAFRKLLTIEQFRDPRLADLYTENQIRLITEYHAGLFKRIMDVGYMKRMDPMTAAWMYNAPVIVMIQEADRHPEKEEEILKQVRIHANTFFEMTTRREDR